MDVIKVEGGAKLHGTVHVEGAKNSALKLMAATVMAPGVYHLSNVPDISDVRLMCKVLQTLGACVVHGEHELIIDTKTVSNWVTPYEYVSKMRASISILGPLITRFGKAIVAMPGGCNIGARSIWSGGTWRENRQRPWQYPCRRHGRPAWRYRHARFPQRGCYREHHDGCR